MHRCDNEFIKENSDIRGFREFRDIMERGVGGEYAPREGVGGVVSATSLLNTTPPSAG